MKKKKKLIAIMCLVILLVVLSFGTLKTSDIKNFPIPITAKVEKVYSEESKDYRFIGINQLYVKHVRLFGWKQVDQLGSLLVFEKNGERVNIITYQNGFNITGESD